MTQLFSGPEIDLKPNELSPRDGSLSKIETGHVANAFDKNLASVVVIEESSKGEGPWVRLNLGEVINNNNNE